MPSRARTLALLVACAAATLALGGCADPWDAPHAAPSPIGTPAPGFLPTPAPTPAATVTPKAGSWNAVRPSPGYRVVLVTAGDDAATRTLVAAVQRWADAEEVDLRTLHVDDDLLAGIVEAIEAGPDLIVSAGETLVDPLETVSANNLDRQFLVIGAELAEPTENVTAVDWTGASYRGDDAARASAFDATSFTSERAGAAVRAGVAAVLHDLTGVVLWID
ncbi:hypothetical protein [Microbacterium sp. KR10-403]|uniref:hypothetical protein n=1 Tax=Microbacterium sp. KR10-403 TaxID=3158581 RepID=UPI0032E3817D